MGALQLQNELVDLQRKEVECRRALEQKEHALKELETSIERLELQISSLRAELGTPLVSQLNETEQAELSELAPGLQKLREELTSLRAECTEVKIRKQQVEEALNSNLRIRCSELETLLEEYDLDALERQVAEGYVHLLFNS